jgi:hypothetical protein
MVLPFALILLGGILLTAAITNRSVVDTALARKDASPLTGGGDGSGGDPLSSGVVPASPGAALAAGSHAPAGLVTVDGHPVCKWMATGMLWSRKHGYWHGSVISGWRDPNEVVTPGAGNPVAPQGKSNHRGKAWPLCAADVTDPEGLERGLKAYPGVLKPRRDLSIHDPGHFSWTGR